MPLPPELPDELVPALLLPLVPEDPVPPGVVCVGAGVVWVGAGVVCVGVGAVWTGAVLVVTGVGVVSAGAVVVAVVVGLLVGVEVVWTCVWRASVVRWLTVAAW